jgi:DNA-binding winged helix-turn-helix (wHTH) protein/tetratricopeptide (TPR) repeat protein
MIEAEANVISRARRVCFGEFELDPEAEELRRGDMPIHLQGVPLRVLAMLLENPGDLVRREAFFKRLWPRDATGILDDNLNSAIRKLRIALDDDARKPRFIETVARRGYRFIAPISAADDTQPAARLDARAMSRIFVGREQEIADLEATLEDCIRERRGWLVVAAGEAGIGKTRLAERLAEDAARRGMTVLWGRSLEGHVGDPPYWPWVQILRALTRGCSEAELAAEIGAGAADIAGILPELQQRLDVTPPDPLASAEQDRFRLFDSIAGYLRAAAQRTPLVLVFDNLHWAGRPSLLLLEFLAQTLAGSPILLFGTYRSAEVSRQHPLFDTLGTLNREPRFLRLQLKGLDRVAVGRFIAQALQHDPPVGLVEAIQRETEGNPFFVSEVVRLLASEGAFAPDAMRAVIGSGEALVIEIPEGIREVIGKRLNQLSPNCNKMLSQAAVVGRQFHLEILSRVVDPPERDGLAHALEEAIEAGVIVEDGLRRGKYRFNHALVRETLYDELSATRRARLHARVGAALEALHAVDPAPYLSQLAYHFAEAARSGYSAQAVTYNVRAAEQAEVQLAYEEAAGFYQAALDAMELDATQDELQVCRLLLAMARSMSKAARVAETQEVAMRGAGIARRLRHVPYLVDACRTMDYLMANLGVGGDKALPLVEETLVALGEEDSAERAELLSCLAKACYLTGQPDQAEAAIAASIAVARRVGEAKALVSAYRARWFSPYPPDKLSERLEATTEMLRLAEELGDGELQRDAHDLCFYDQLELGDPVRADEHLRRSGELGQAIRQPFHITNHLVYRAMRAIMEGRYAAGEALALEALQAGRRVRRDSAEGLFSMQMFAIRRDQGRLGELAGVLDLFVRDQEAQAVWRPGLALLYAKLERQREAKEAFEYLARDEFAGVARDALWPTCLAYLSEVAVYLEDRDRAATLYGFLQPYAGRNLVVGASVAFLGAAGDYLGMLATALGRDEQARRHFEEALELNARMSAWPWLARSRHRLAVYLLCSSAERDRAAALLEDALKTSQALGMAALEKRVRASQAVLADSH